MSDFVPFGSQESITLWYIKYLRAKDTDN